MTVHCLLSWISLVWEKIWESCIDPSCGLNIKRKCPPQRTQMETLTERAWVCVCVCHQVLAAYLFKILQEQNYKNSCSNPHLLKFYYIFKYFFYLFKWHSIQVLKVFIFIWDICESSPSGNTGPFSFLRCEIVVKLNSVPTLL